MGEEVTSPEIKIVAQPDGYSVWELFGWNYNGPDWIVPLYKRIAVFEQREEAEAFVAMIPIPIPEPPF